jgi:hypothetical protein
MDIDKNSVQERMAELMQLIDNSIQLIDSEEELLMLACAMQQRTREIFDSVLGVEGRKMMFKELT